MNTTEEKKPKDGEDLTIAGFKNLLIHDEESEPNAEANDHSHTKDPSEDWETPFVHEYIKTAKLIEENEEENNNQAELNAHEESKRADCTFADLPEKTGFLYKKSSMFFIGWQKRYFTYF